MNFPAIKRARIYKKPGMYLSGPPLRVPTRCRAVAELAIAPSELLESILDIDYLWLRSDLGAMSHAPECRYRAAHLINAFAGRRCHVADRRPFVDVSPLRRVAAASGSVSCEHVPIGPRTTSIHRQRRRDETRRTHSWHATKPRWAGRRPGAASGTAIAGIPS